MPVGIPAAMLISGLASAGGGIASSALNNRKSTSTANTTQKSTTNTNGTAATRRELTPEQQGMMPVLSSVAMDRITNPGARLAPLQGFMRAGVNSNYAGAEEALRSKYGRSGGAKSGKMGTALRAVESSRLGALSGVDSDYAKMVLQDQDSGVSLLERLLAQNFGQTSTQNQTSETNSTGTQTGMQIGPNTGALGVASGALGSGLETMMTLQMIDKMLKGGGGGDPLSGMMPHNNTGYNLLNQLYGGPAPSWP